MGFYLVVCVFGTTCALGIVGFWRWGGWGVLLVLLDYFGVDWLVACGLLV